MLMTHSCLNRVSSKRLKFSFNNLEYCTADIQLWMAQNLLKLNENKTNIIYLTSTHCVQSLRTPALQMGH